MALFRRKGSDVIIDLRVQPAPAGRPSWGSPIPCPVCSGRGYVDHIDPFREVMFLHCTACEHKYELARAVLEGVDS